MMKKVVKYCFDLLKLLYSFRFLRSHNQTRELIDGKGKRSTLRQ